ncbi:MAG: histidine phosphatase family protein [Erysipelotrichaceae bacterium]|nr:histidine phosphatase family protein [Erysipelotrichaceae bacterium]
MRTIYLVRHGKPYFEGPRIALGQGNDVPVLQEYLEKAKDLRGFFADKDIDFYYSSPLLRARQTLSAFIPEGQRPIILPGIIEANYGNWEGVDITKLTPSYGQGYIDSCRGVTYPGIPDIGHPEHVHDVSTRAIEALRNTTGNSVVVAHTTVISLTCSELYGLDWRDYRQYKIPYLSITTVKEEDGKLTVEELAYDYLELGLS